MRQIRLWSSIALAAVATLMAEDARAQAGENFYRTTSLRLIIGEGPGGGHDTYARTVARHLNKHIPGTPNIIPQNMPGASSLVAMNHIYNVAQRDGSVISLANAVVTLQPMLGNPGVRFDLLKLNWIGSLQRQRVVCVTRHDSPTKTIEDARNRETLVSASANTGARATVPSLINDVLGTKFKVITGYSTREQPLAVERGEVDGLCGISYSTLMSTQPHWITEKKVNILAQLALTKDPRFPDTPMVIDLVQEPEARRMLEWALIPQELGMPVVAPPEIPPDRLQILRTAFAETLKDPQFLADATKSRLDIDGLDYVVIERLLKNASTVSKEIVERAAPLLK